MQTSYDPLMPALSLSFDQSAEHVRRMVEKWLPLCRSLEELEERLATDPHLSCLMLESALELAGQRFSAVEAERRLCEIQDREALLELAEGHRAKFPGPVSDQLQLALLRDLRIPRDQIASLLEELAERRRQRLSGKEGIRSWRREARREYRWMGDAEWLLGIAIAFLAAIFARWLASQLPIPTEKSEVVLEWLLTAIFWYGIFLIVKERRKTAG